MWKTKSMPVSPGHHFNLLTILLLSIICCHEGTSSPLVAAELQYPVAVAVGPSGTIYVADRKLPGIWQLKNEKLEVFVPGDKKFGGFLNAIRCLAIDGDGQLLVGDSATREIYRIDKEKKITPLTSRGIGIPMDIAVTAQGDLLVSDLELHCVWKVAKAGGKPTKLATLAGPSGVALDDKQHLWVVSRAKNPLQKILPDGTVETVVAKRPFQFPNDVIVDKNGVAFVTDSYQKCIWKVVPGQPPESWVSGGSLQNPVGITWSGQDLIVVDSRARDVFKISADGKTITSLTGKEASLDQK
jgi:streptogramin lyase